MSEPKASILPIYFVVDCSASMQPYVEQLNHGLVSLLSALQTETMAAAMVRFSVLGFNHQATCYLPPTDMREISVEQLPLLKVSGATSYVAAFEALGQRLPSDISILKEDGYLVNRPVVFFLSDGAPTDSVSAWKSALSSISRDQLKQYPNRLAFGIGNANANVIRQVASAPQYAFQQDSGIDTGVAIAEFIDALIGSVMSSGQALATGGSAVIEMEKPKGYISLDMETV